MHGVPHGLPKGLWLLCGQLGLDVADPLENDLEVLLHLHNVLGVLLEVVLRPLEAGGGETVHVGQHLVGLLKALQHLLLCADNQLHVALIYDTSQTLEFSCHVER